MFRPTTRGFLVNVRAATLDAETQVYQFHMTLITIPDAPTSGAGDEQSGAVLQKIDPEAGFNPTLSTGGVGTKPGGVSAVETGQVEQVSDIHATP